MRLENRTDFDTKVLRKLCARVLKEMGASSDKIIKVQYGDEWYLNGVADLGRYIEMKRIHMYIPKNDKKLNLRSFYRVFEHEVAHTLGVDHKDMDRRIFLCVQEIPNYVKRDFPRELGRSKE